MRWTALLREREGERGRGRGREGKGEGGKGREGKGEGERGCVKLFGGRLYVYCTERGCLCVCVCVCVCVCELICCLSVHSFMLTVHLEYSGEGLPSEIGEHSTKLTTLDL